MNLILIRHGESVWNKENKFTGWTDVGLSSKGIDEAIEAGKFLKEHNIVYDKAYTSVLKRAIDTLYYVMRENHETSVTKAWQLNERHYGALQGLNKDEMKAKYGEEKVHEWRRSYKTKPPVLTKDDERYPGNDHLYDDVPRDLLPLSESLEDTVSRVIPYYEENIKKDLDNGQNVLIVAHGNSLRALIKYIENISDEDIPNLELPTGKPILYKYENGNYTKIEKYD